MARLLTVGYEIAEKGSSSANLIDIDGGSSTPADWAIQNTTVRSGGFALERAAAGSTWHSNWSTGSGVADRTYYARFYFRIAGTPSANANLCAFVDSALTIIGRIVLTTSLTLQLQGGAGAAIGSDSSALVANTWYMIELAQRNGSSANTDYVEGRLDGVSFASTSTDDSITINPVGLRYGSSTSHGQVCHYDDLAVNDDQGSDQNSWPGQGKIVLLKPISDNQAGSWTGGAGGTTSLFDAVDNTPPVGTATETDTSQIESTDTSGDNSTDEIRLDLTTYENAGVDSYDTINVIHPIINHGQDAAGSAMAGSFGLQANPAQTYKAFTFGDNVGALGTWPSNWRWTLGDPIYAPSVTTTSSPVLAIRKTDAVAGTGSVDFAGAYVEYVDGTPATNLAYYIPPMRIY